MTRSRYWPLLLGALFVPIVPACVITFPEYTVEDGGGAGAGGSPPEAGRVCIDQVEAFPVPPAGYRITFRALDGAGSPLRRLAPATGDAGDVTIIDGDSGQPLTELSGRVSNVEPLLELSETFVDPLERYTVIAIDVSSEAVASGGTEAMKTAAVAYLDKIRRDDLWEVFPWVRVMTFARPDLISWLTPVVDIFEAMDAMNALDVAEGLGARDLDDAYIYALEALAEVGTPGRRIQRTALFFTAGASEVGAQVRPTALERRNTSDASKYIVLTDPAATCAVEELAGGSVTCEDKPSCRPQDACEDGVPSTCPQLYVAAGGEALEEVADDIAEKESAMARSSYRVGLCTPMVFEAVVTIRADVDGATGEGTVTTPSGTNTGDIDNCDETLNRDLDSRPECRLGEECGSGICDPSSQTCSS